MSDVSISCSIARLLCHNTYVKLWRSLHMFDCSLEFTQHLARPFKIMINHCTADKAIRGLS